MQNNNQDNKEGNNNQDINFRVTVKSFILNEKDELLLLKRAAHLPVMPGIWEVPGGRLELGENPFEGLKREVMEETNLDVEVQDPVSVKHFTRSDGQTITMIIFRCTANSENVIISPKEHDDFKWLDISKAKDEITSFLQKDVVLLIDKNASMG